MFYRTKDRNDGPDRSVASRRRGGAAKVVVVLLALAAVAAGGFAAWRHNRSKTGKQVAVIYATVEKGTFVHEVNGKGSAESAKNVDVASQVEGSATIIYLIPEGTDVKKGDRLVELDSSSIDEKLDSQVVTTNSSRATLNSSRATLRSAEISLEEYVEGTFAQSWMEYENTIFEAEQTRKQNADSARFTERLLNLDYSTELQYEIDKVAEEKAKNSLEVAELKKLTLLQYTSEKQITSLMSDIETARAKVDSDKNSYAINLSRENRYRAQSANCVIRAPQDGQVVYANQDSRRMSESEMIKEGSTVRQRQVLVRLPDKTQMQVKAMINESNISSVAVGMDALISFDSIPNRVVKGTVSKVNLYPEIVWMSSAKDYVTLVKIDEDVPELRSGLTAQVRIIADRQEDVLMLPVQCVTEVGKKTYCITYLNGVWGYKEVLLGASNEKQVIVLKGLDEGDVVVSGARLYRDKLNFPTAEEPSEFADDPEYQAKMTAAKEAEAKEAELEAGGAEGGAPGGMAGGPGMGGGAPGGMGGGPGMGGGAPGGMAGGPGMGGDAPGGMGGGPGMGGGMPNLTDEQKAAIAAKIASGEIKLPPGVSLPGMGGAGDVSDDELEEQNKKKEEARVYAATIEEELARDVKIAKIKGFFGRTVMGMLRELKSAIEKKSGDLQSRIAARQRKILKRQNEIVSIREGRGVYADLSEDERQAKIDGFVAEINALRGGESNANGEIEPKYGPEENVAYLDEIDWGKYDCAKALRRDALVFLGENSDAIFDSIFPNSTDVETKEIDSENNDEEVADETANVDPTVKADFAQYAAFLDLYDDWNTDSSDAMRPTEFVVGFFSDRKSFLNVESDEVVDKLFDEFDVEKEEGVAEDERVLTADEIAQVSDKILRERAATEEKSAGGKRGGGRRGGGFPGMGGGMAGGPGMGGGMPGGMADGPGMGGGMPGGMAGGPGTSGGMPGEMAGGEGGRPGRGPRPNADGAPNETAGGASELKPGEGPAPEDAPAVENEPITALEDATSLRQAIALYVAKMDFDGDGFVAKDEFVKGYRVVEDVAGKTFSNTSLATNAVDAGGGGFPGPPPM